MGPPELKPHPLVAQLDQWLDGMENRPAMYVGHTLEALDEMYWTVLDIRLALAHEKPLWGDVSAHRAFSQFVFECEYEKDGKRLRCNIPLAAQCETQEEMVGWLKKLRAWALRRLPLPPEERRILAADAVDGIAFRETEEAWAARQKR